MWIMLKLLLLVFCSLLFFVFNSGWGWGASVHIYVMVMDLLCPACLPAKFQTEIQHDDQFNRRHNITLNAKSIALQSINHDSTSNTRTRQ